MLCKIITRVTCGNGDHGAILDFSLWETLMWWFSLWKITMFALGMMGGGRGEMPGGPLEDCHLHSRRRLWTAPRIVAVRGLDKIESCQGRLEMQDLVMDSRGIFISLAWYWGSLIIWSSPLPSSSLTCLDIPASFPSPPWLLELYYQLQSLCYQLQSFLDFKLHKVRDHIFFARFWILCI